MLGVVGNLSRAAFQCPGQPQPTVLEGDLEVITLNGTLSPAMDLHLSLSDGACRCGVDISNPAPWCRKGSTCWWECSSSRSQPPTAAQPRPLHSRPASRSPCCWVVPGAHGPAAAAHPGSAHTVDTVNDDAAFSRWQTRSGMRTFPQVFIDGELLGGYDDLASCTRPAAEQLRASAMATPESLSRHPGPQTPWCQPWTILLTGSLAIGGSWLLLHWLWLTLPIALLVMIWWWLFLIAVPSSSTQPPMPPEP